MESLIKESKSSVWLNDEVLNNEELENIRKLNPEITNFTHLIEKDNEKELSRALETIRLHHPGETIWIEA